MTAQKWIFTIVVCAGVLIPRPTAAQHADPNLANRMLYCAMHEPEGPWVPKELRSDGILHFNYLHELPTSKNIEDSASLDRMYVAFWNDSKSKGEFLDFTINHSAARRWLTVTNEGHISYKKAKLDLDFFQGGIGTEEEYMKLLRKLVAAPVQAIAVRDIKRTDVLCDSLLDPHPEWDTQPSAKK